MSPSMVAHPPREWLSPSFFRSCGTGNGPLLAPGHRHRRYGGGAGLCAYGGRRSARRSGEKVRRRAPLFWVYASRAKRRDRVVAVGARAKPFSPSLIFWFTPRPRAEPMRSRCRHRSSLARPGAMRTQAERAREWETGRHARFRPAGRLHRHEAHQRARHGFPRRRIVQRVPLRLSDRSGDPSTDRSSPSGRRRHGGRHGLLRHLRRSA
jgi:hypothetical protein